MDQTALITRNYLLYVLLPVWILPGLADYFCHRRTNIETTSGTHESWIHLGMLAVVGSPVLMGLFLDINTLVILLMIGAFLGHEVLAWWDVSYAVTRRQVNPFEQHMHSFLEVLPFMAVSFVICLHWGQFLALWGLGDEPARFTLELKKPPLSGTYVVGMISAIGLFLALPYAEELWRCYRAAKKGS
jgi:hypothetical protein